MLCPPASPDRAALRSWQNQIVDCQLDGTNGHTVGKWRDRYPELDLEDLYDRLSLGRSRAYDDDDTVAEVINRAL